jgi:PKD repeat protein
MKKMEGSLAIVIIAAILLAALPSTPLAAEPTGDLVLARMPAGAYDETLVTAQRALDYGTFVWLELTTAQFAQLQQSGLPYQVYSEAFTLSLGGTSFDTREGQPVLPAGWAAIPAEGPDLHLVQVIGPARAEWFETLRNSGLEIVQYIYPFSYVVWGEARAVEGAAQFDFVRWTGPFAPAYRVLPQWRNLPDTLVDVNVLLYRGTDTDTTLGRFEALGGSLQGRTVLNHTYEIAGFGISGARLQEAARIPGVYSIQLRKTDGGLRGEMSNQINVNNHDQDNYAYPGYLDWLAAAGVDGSGVIIANVDGGVEDTHPDLVNRIIPCTGQTCGGGDSSSHGTHTAGIMAADASSGVKDAYGFYRGLGMAPGADLVEQVYSPWFTQPGGMLLLMKESYNNGASLSGNSWGPSGSPQGYDDDTMQVDIGVRDADQDAAGNQSMQYVLSIMNGGGGSQTQGTPDEAKNIFTIGSTKMQNGDGSQDPNINDLSANTAHGPCLDGRLIPHLVAPGCEVDSTTTGAGYTLMCGTSMASPHVSGAVALFIEYYRGLFGIDPSQAMIKAAFLPVAHDLAGYDDADGNPLGHPFDAKQGWGRMDAAAVVSPTAMIEYFDNPLIFDNTGEEWITVVGVADPTKPVKIMLVWTDAPGHGLGGVTPAWNNDLDLVVEYNGDTYYGNDFGDDGWSEPGVDADYQNNTEGVFLGPTASGSATIHVVASDINSDGIPNYGDDTDQDFSLVCWNCARGADFSLSADPNSFEVCAPEVVTSTIEVGQIMTYPHDVTLQVLNLPAGVTSELVPMVVTPPGEATLALTVSAGAADGDYTIVVSGTAEMTNVHTTEIDLLVNSDAPGTPTLIEPPNGATGLPYDEVTFVWSTFPLVHNYSLQVDTVPDFSAPLVSITGIPTGTYTVDQGLQPASCYFWRTMAENSCGEGPWATPFHFGTVLLDQAFMDDVEGGGSNWTATGLWHISTDPADPCAEPHSGSSSWYYGQEPGCDYDVGPTQGTLTMLNPVDLSTVLAPASLRFWSWEETEGASSYDLRKVYLSPNGSTWTEVWSSTDNSASWYQVELDVSSYVGGDLYVRFEFDSVDDFLNGYRGWYVDDIEILAGMEPNNPPQIVSITPDSGSSFSETPVTIEGSDFQPTPFVQLDGTLLLSVTYVSSTTLTAVVPAGMAPGVYDLMIINPDCQDDILLDAFTVIGQCISPTVILDNDSPVELGAPMHFTATLISGTAPYTYTWDFGGPGYGSGEDTATPVYTYTAPGAFTASVTVENECGSDTAMGTVIVIEPCIPPAAGVESDSPVELGQPMAFTATVTGTAPFTYTWDFGGSGYGSGEDGPTPLFTYTDSGAYTVTLTVENDCGSDTLSTTVVVLCSEPTADFVSNSPVMLGEPMAFTSTVSGSGPFTYTWDFGDGVGMSNEPHPVYTYTQSGAFTVTLTVQGLCGEDTITASVSVLPSTVYKLYLPLITKNATP